MIENTSFRKWTVRKIFAWSEWLVYTFLVHFYIILILKLCCANYRKRFLSAFCCAILWAISVCFFRLSEEFVWYAQSLQFQSPSFVCWSMCLCNCSFVLNWLSQEPQLTIGFAVGFEWGPSLVKPLSLPLSKTFSWLGLILSSALDSAPGSSFDDFILRISRFRSSICFK